MFYEKPKIIIVGKSGSGKDTLKKALIENGLKSIVQTTTRPIRNNEENGKDYHFVSTTDFIRSTPNMVEYRYYKFRNTWFGTTKYDMDNGDILITNPRQIQSLINRGYNCIVIYLDVDEDVLRQRLKDRGDSEFDIDTRLKSDSEDNKTFLNYSNYDLRFDIIINSEGKVSDYVLNEIFKKVNGK